MKRLSVFAGLMLLALSTAAQASDAIANWSAPSSWTPPSTQAVGRSALVTYPPLPFIPLSPCRLADIRAGSGFPAGYGPPAIGSGGVRNFVITGQCGIPAGAQAVSFNFAVWAPTTRADLRAYPAGASPVPVVSTLNWEAGILALANAAVVPLGVGGAITVQNDGLTPLEIFIDVNGYYSGAVGASPFVISATSGYGIFGASGAGTGVAGFGTVAGVFGNSSAGIGVHGQSLSNVGVLGNSSSSVGVQGISLSSNGVFGTTAAPGIAGVVGFNTSIADGSHGVGGFEGGTGIVFGVQGQIGAGAAVGSAGVHGIGGFGASTFGVFGQQGATIPIVFGLGTIGGYFTSTGSVGALGLATGRGLQGSTVNTTTGAFINSGVIGFTGTSGVHSFQDITAGGVKSFVEPHPSDPGKQIVYIAMEGPEAGTYFRGRGRFEGRTAVIVVPESFRLVTEEEGLTVQITPIGRATAVGVLSMDLTQIVVESTSRDVEFSYFVQGVRHHRGQFEPIQTNSYFVPASPDARMDPWPRQIQKQLVDLGIYFADGRVNMQTAEKMGWAQRWRDDEAKVKATQEAAAAKGQ